jgi:arylsulfatase A-like enzyme
MKAIMLMFDSLNKRLLSAYGSDRAITPNFQRLRERTVRFDNFLCRQYALYASPRELHTGRYNFLHRGWSPLEPFDDSVPEILKKNGIHTHLVTDHKHYWRDGGATYHSRYSTYEFVRGQEGDAWKGVVDKPEYRYESGEPRRSSSGESPAGCSIRSTSSLCRMKRIIIWRGRSARAGVY